MQRHALPAPASIAAARPTAHAATEARRLSSHWVLLGGVLALSAAYASWHLSRGMIPHDEGAMGLAAERVLRGDLPHRDFDDIYTGGLAWLNSWGFRLLGVSVRTMRLVLLAAFLAWIPAVYYIATRLVRPVAAAAVTLLAAAWSIPVYPGPMPSWYNLFLATAGTAALLRGLEDGRRRWLVLAGLAGGLSILIKIVGLYYVAAVLLYLVSRAHDGSRERAGAEPGGGLVYRVVVSGGLLLFVGALVALIRHGFAAPEVVHFVMPGTLVAALLLHDEWAQPAGPSRARFVVLARLLWPFLLGVTVPVALFLIPYVASGAVTDIVYGVLISPARRFAFVSMPLMPLSTMAAVIPLVVVVAAALRLPNTIAPSLRTAIAAAAIAALVLLLVATGHSDRAYSAVWLSARNIVPVLAIAGVALLARRHDGAIDSDRRARLLLLVSVTALCSLVQFPTALPIYFCFVAPLAVLLATALYRELPPMPPAIPAALVAFYLAFPVARVHTSMLYGMGEHFMPYPPTRPMALPRSGVSPIVEQADAYEAVGLLLRQHARGGYTWASPDAPEIYFFTGLRNPTRTLFELFDDPVRHHERVLTSLDAHGVTAIVLNRMPESSPYITPRMFAVLAERFPESADVGRFHVRWKP